MNRIYLDFDGVVAPLKPVVEDERDWVAVNMPYTGRTLARKEVLYFLSRFEGEIVWVTHRDPEDIQRFAEVTGIPTFRHLAFGDPTGSKIQAIWDDVDANPLPDPEDAIVIDDELTDEEIEELTMRVPVYKPNGEYGLDVEDFKWHVLGG